MSAIASQITILTIAYSTVYPGADQSKHQSSASLAFVWGIHRGTAEFPVQMPSNAENVSIWWRHHGVCENVYVHAVYQTLYAHNFVTFCFVSVVISVHVDL